jgi:hypothetical protein
MFTDKIQIKLTARRKNIRIRIHNTDVYIIFWGEGGRVAGVRHKSNQRRPYLTKPSYLKVLTNEKRDGLSVVSFDRPRFKLYSQKFSNKSV